MSGADAFLDREYKPDSGVTVDAVPRGSMKQPTERRAGLEDKEAAESDATGKVSQREVKDLQSDVWPQEKDVSGGRTRGAKVDAYKQERALDKALDESGITDADQDVEIGAASGR